MKVLSRIERLEARTPRLPKRIILVWVDREARRTKTADTHPNLPDPGEYDADISGCHPGGGIQQYVTEAN